MVATLQLLTEDEKLAIVDHPQEFKKFAADLVCGKIFFTYLSDEEAITTLVDRKAYERRGSERIVREWRRIATTLDFTGPVVVLVRSGFGLKAAPGLGPCYEQWVYLQDWKFKNSEPTVDLLAFFVPRLVADSTNKNQNEQLEILATLREIHTLPGHHLSRFGDANLLAGLILSHFQRTGERTPLNRFWVRTDTERLDNWYLLLGDFGDGGLDCSCWGYDVDDRDDGLGCFPLGVEVLGV